jgi:hypothetical protein
VSPTSAPELPPAARGALLRLFGCYGRAGALGGFWGPLLFFAPLALFMALTILVLWVVGRWFGRRNR